MNELEGFELEVRCDRSTARYLYNIKINTAFCYIWQIDDHYRVAAGIRSIDDAEFYFFKTVNNLGEACNLYTTIKEYIKLHKNNMNGYDMRTFTIDLGFTDDSN